MSRTNSDGVLQCIQFAEKEYCTGWLVSKQTHASVRAY